MDPIVRFNLTMIWDRARTARWCAPLLAAFSLTLAAGCNSADKGAGAGSRATSPVNKNLSARDNLAALATKERAARPASLEPINAPVPPGVDPAILELRDASDNRARMDLKTALKDIQDHMPAPEPVAHREPVDDDAKTQALKFYVRGREAALDNKHLVAVTELQKAQELNPDAPQIMRELARSYLKVGNSGKAVELFERLTLADPTDSEALFTVGLALANRREFARAAMVLGTFRAQNRNFDHDPVADILVDFTLAIAMRELGYDRASIEAGNESLNLPESLSSSTDYAMRLGSVYRQRGETWRAIGDAFCRLGEYEGALEAYETSARLPTADRSAAHPRVIHANLRLGRMYSAQQELLEALEAGAGSVNDRDIRLCAYLAEYGQPIDLLRRSAVEMYRAQPENAALARAAASLLEQEEALSLLREFVQRRPRDLQAVSQLLAWLAQRDVSAAVALTVALSADHPDMSERYTEQLVQAVARVSDAIDAAQSQPASAARARVEARLLAAVDAKGEAWAVCRKAREQWPDDGGLRVLEIRLAAALEEPELLKPVVSQRNSLDVPGLVALARAQRMLGEHDASVQTAHLALERSGEDFDALVEMARAHAGRATATAMGTGEKSAARADVDSAGQYAELAIAIDPARDEPYEVLAMMFGRGGPLADTQLFRDSMQRLYQANSNSPLYARLAAEEAIGQRRYEQALERLVNLCESDTSDNQSLRLAVLAWERWGRMDAAADWLDRRLQARPGDPGLMEQWVLVKLRQDKAPEARARLESELAAHPDDYAVRRLLEQVYRAAGEGASAMELGEKRLLARPQGMRREVELAALYAGAGRWDKALSQLEWVRDHAAEGTEDQLASAVSITARLEGDDERRDSLTLDLVQRTVEAYPESSLETYGSGLRALARMNRLDATFDELADRAAANALGATGVTNNEVIRWVELAQALVQDEQPAAAARAVRARIRAAANPLPDGFLGDLATVTFAADAASTDMADESIALARELDRRGALRLLSSLDEPATLGEALFQVSSMYTMVGNRAGAEFLLRQALGLEPKMAMAMNNLGYARLVAGHLDEETVTMIETAQELVPNDPNILDTVGWLRYRQGRFNDDPAGVKGDVSTFGAASLIQAALDADVAVPGGRTMEPHIPSPEVLDHLGDVKWRLGDTHGATEAWKRSASVLEDRAYEERILQQYLLVQTRLWRLLVASPREMYDREYGSVLQRVKSKLHALEHGTEPAVAPTFAEEEARKASEH